MPSADAGVGSDPPAREVQHMHVRHTITRLLSGGVLQVLSAPVYENEKPDHGGNNAALLGPTVVPLA